jgi:16S rRNA (guanine527-N7)-methyltransferase
LAKLDRYAELLVEWNQMFNLVAASTLPHIWKRHFLDSAQLRRFIPPEAESIADLGSGAGFPGLVLAILGAPKIYLIESVGKKAKFLHEVIDELKVDAVVRHERAEQIKDLKVDIITARACASLNELLTVAKPLAKPDSLYLFPKGQNVDAELTESAKYWTFTHAKRQSISDGSGSVLILKDVKSKNGLFRKKHR